MDTRELRKCFGKFATGVTVVSWSDKEPRGITVNSFTTISLEPPLILISIDKKSRSHDSLQDSPFVVNILSNEQEKIAMHFAGRPEPDLRVEWDESDIAPRLKDVLAFIECKFWKSYDGGDHTMFLGEVVNFHYRAGDGLGFFGGKFHTVTEQA